MKMKKAIVITAAVCAALMAGAANAAPISAGKVVLKTMYGRD